MRSRAIPPCWRPWLATIERSETGTVTKVRDDRLAEIRDTGDWRTRTRNSAERTKITRGMFATIRYLGDCTQPDTTTLKDYMRDHPPTIL